MESGKRLSVGGGAFFLLCPGVGSCGNSDGWWGLSVGVRLHVKLGRLKIIQWIQWGAKQGADETLGRDKMK